MIDEVHKKCEETEARKHQVHHECRNNNRDGTF